MEHRRRAMAPFFRDGALWLERPLTVWLACALLYRMFVVMNPEFEFPLPATSPLRTSVAKVYVVVTWMLLVILFFPGVRRMLAVVSELGVFMFKQFLWMLVRNLLTLSPIFSHLARTAELLGTIFLSGIRRAANRPFLFMVVWNLLILLPLLLPLLLPYDFWLIKVIDMYTRWTSKFVVMVGELAHLVYQLNFIRMRLNRENMNVSRLAVMNALVNAVMLLYFFYTFVMFKIQPLQLLDTIWFVVLELLFRVVALVTFVHVYFQQLRRHCMNINRRDETEFETEFEHNSKTTLVYTVASFYPSYEEAWDRVFQPLQQHETEFEYNNSDIALVHMAASFSLPNEEAQHQVSQSLYRDETEFEHNSGTSLVYIAVSSSQLNEEAQHQVFPPLHISQFLLPLEEHEIIPEQIRNQNSQSGKLVAPLPTLHTKSQPQQSICVCTGCLNEFDV